MLSERRRQYLEAIGIDLWVQRPRGISATQEPARPEPVTTGPRAAAAVTSGEAAAQWQELLEEVRRCTLCPLHTTRTQGVLGVGPKRADWLVIGEAPGAEEDRRGEPFVGAAGQLLDAMLRAIGLDRHTNVYIANVLKSRPPNNRDPKPEEVAACLPYLVRQIALLQPKIMLAVGRIAAQNLLGTARAAAGSGAPLRRAPNSARSHVSSRLSAAHAGRQAQGVGGPEVCPQRVPTSDARRPRWPPLLNCSSPRS